VTLVTLLDVFDRKAVSTRDLSKCGEQDKDKLPIYTAAGVDYVRVDACDRCRTYIKSVDLTKDGCAIPVVDELATVALNIGADGHGTPSWNPTFWGSNV
jgi:FdhE protein